jgi:deoxyribose-phosphate aldolase
MIIEYAYHDLEATEQNIKDNLKEITKRPIASLSVLYPNIKLASKLLPDNIILSTIIDYPLGISDTYARNYLVKNSIGYGAKHINMVAPNHYLINKNYNKLKEDIASNVEICKTHKVEISYTLEYRVFTYDSLYRVCKILQSGGINKIYISTGFRVDDIHDHILAIAMIKKNVPDIKITCNCNIWNQSHIKLLKDSKIETLRVSSLSSLILSMNI